MNNSGMRDELYYALNEDQRDALRKPIQEESIMCNCIERTNEALAKNGENTELAVPLMLNYKTGKLTAKRLLVATQKRDSNNRKKPVPFFATYCPFCGEKYPDE